MRCDGRRYPPDHGGARGHQGLCRKHGSSRPQEGSDHTFAYNAEFQTGRDFLHGELVALGTFVMASLQDNYPNWPGRVYAGTGPLCQPGGIGLGQEEFVRTLGTLSWYQRNFGRCTSVLDERSIDPGFVDRMVSEMEF